MLLFLTALICAGAVLFVGIPAALDRANRIHIEKGRKPDAGIAFMPDLIVMVGLWWGVGAGLQYFFGLPKALVVVVAVSAILFVWQILQARRSNREYSQFVAEHDLISNSSATNQKQAE
jgi:hypothetical protein